MTNFFWMKFLILSIKNRLLELISRVGLKNSGIQETTRKF